MADKKVKAPTAYFVFTEVNRAAAHSELLKDQPEGSKVSVAVVAKALGEKWKALSEQDKQKYKDIATQKKAEAEERAAARQADGEAADQEDPSEPAHIHQGFPKAVLKRLMHMDPEVSRASGDAVVCVGKAVELFIELLASKCSRAAAANKRKTIKLDDVTAVVKSDKRFVLAGLKDVTAGVKSKEDQAAAVAPTAGTKRKAAADLAAAAGDDDDTAGAAAADATEGGADQEEGKSGAASGEKGAKKGKPAAKKAAAAAAAVEKTHKITTFFVKRPAAVMATADGDQGMTPPSPRLGSQ